MKGYPMYEKTIPEGPAREKRRRALARAVTLTGTSAFILAILAVLLLVAVVVVLFLFEFKRSEQTLTVILLLSFTGGAVATAFASFFLARRNGALEDRLQDYLERLDSPLSFLVGEDTYATFAEDALRLHAEGKPEVKVPYAEISLYSVCSRRAPREKGEWSVLIEIPAHYLLKKEKDAPPALVQTQYKPRLAEVLKERGLVLAGEPYRDGQSKKPFKPLKKFFLPNRERRRRALPVIILGGILAAVSVPVWIFLNGAVGAIFLVFGLFILGRGIWAFHEARAIVGFYGEGLYWRESRGGESLFLKWEEIVSLRIGAEEGLPVLAISCLYGEYRIPRPQGTEEYLRNTRPEIIT